jgi:hypothetical protein
VRELQNGEESAISIMYLEISYGDFSGIQNDDEIRVFHFVHHDAHELEQRMKLTIRKTSLWTNSEMTKKRRF